MTERLLVLAPTARDSELSREILTSAGLTMQPCADLGEVCREVESGAGAVLLTDASLSAENPERLAEVLRSQPAWSDIPVILLSPRGPDSPTAVWAMNALSNITVLEQPVRVMTLVSALRTAMKARARQYELRDRLEALRLADRQKDEFLAMLSHELRNPLAPIRTSIHVLQRAGIDADTRTRALDTVERQVGTLIRLVDDLLEVSRITHGKIELQRQRVSLGDLLRGTAESIAPVVSRRGQTLTVIEPPEPVFIDADPVRFNQVVTNLLNNAMRYTPRGGDIRLAGRREGPEAVISVQDTGVGIPPAMLPRVFDLFVQADSGSDRVREGLGIGLTLVKRLVELHGGTVEAHSAGTGQGSEFRVRLPVCRDAAESDPARAPRQAGATDGPDETQEGHTFRILVVDDYRDAADALATLLREFGHEVEVAYDGPAALAAAIRFRPDVVVLDIGLPGMNGREVAARLRQEAGFEHGLLLALTGYGRDEDRNRSLEAGFDDHLIKPLNLDAFHARLAAYRRTTRPHPSRHDARHGLSLPRGG